MTELGIMGYTKAMSAMNTAMDTAGDSSLVGKFTIESFFKKITGFGKTYGGYFIMFMGVIALVFAVFKTVTNLMSKQGATTSWGVIAVLYVVGLVCLGGGIAVLFASANDVNNEVLGG